MALITTIKRCLGFGVTDDEEDYEALAADALRAGIATPPFHEPAPNQAPAVINEPPTEHPTTTPGECSARLTELLLDIVRNSMASPRFNAELVRLAGGGTADDFQVERARLVEEIRKLKEQSSSTSMLTTELNNLRLSTQRQQRAYTDRINELMDQINRMAGKKSAPQPDLPDPLIADLQDQLNSREDKIRELNDIIKSLNLKLQMSDEMIKNLNKNNADLKAEYKEKCKKYEEEVDRVNDRLIDANSIIESLNKRLSMLGQQEEARRETDRPASVQTTSKDKKRKKRKEKNMPSDDDKSPNTLADTGWLDTEAINTMKDSDDNKRQMSLF